MEQAHSLGLDYSIPYPYMQKGLHTYNCCMLSSLDATSSMFLQYLGEIMFLLLYMLYNVHVHVPLEVEEEGQH